MYLLGAHVSASGGVENAPINAKELKANAFALFTKNQRQWTAAPLSKESIAAFNKNILEANISKDAVLPHDSYLINLGNFNREKREKSYQAFLDEVIRTNELGLTLLNFHPGSHLEECSEEESLDLIAECMNKAIAETSNTILVIENTAGQGSNLGYKFEHLAYLIKKINNKKRVGICLDTCHTHSSGYDLSTKDSFQHTMDEFERIVGFKYLRGMHLNDSKTPFNSKKDRHEELGLGSLGKTPFELIMKDKRFEDIPLILETPNDEKWAQEIEWLRSLSL